MTIWSRISRLRGRVPPEFDVADRSALEANWAFRPSRPRWTVRVIRAGAVLTGLRWRPQRRELIPAKAGPRWICYFIYLPTGELSDAQRFTLARLRDMSRQLMVVCAAPSPAMVPQELHDLVDALLWKGLRGFDFSAYAYGLEVLASRASGADVLVMNDSIFGPFTDLEPLVAAAPWRLTAFTAFSNIENHIQSYAFHIRNLDRVVLRALRPAVPKFLVFDRYQDVVYCQETRLARVAGRTMSVGALWFADFVHCGDPSLYASLDLLEGGFPFLKKSLFGRNKTIQPQALLRKALTDRGHPLPPDME